MSAPDFAACCEADVLATLRSVGAKAATVQEATELGILTDLEWSACLALYQRKECAGNPVNRKHPTRRMNWKAPQIGKKIRQLFARGWSQLQIARHLGVSKSALNQACVTYGWYEPPKGWMRGGELASTLNISHATADYHVQRSGKARPWGVEHIIPVKVAEQIISDHRPRVTAPPPGYVTARQMAERWGQSINAVQRRLRPLPCVLVRRGRHTTRYYDPRDVLPLAPMRYRQRPAGLLTLKALAEVLGVSRATLRTWRKRYALPALPWRAWDNKTLLFDPHELASWFAAQPALAHHAPKLQALAAQGRKVAA